MHVFNVSRYVHIYIFIYLIQYPYLCTQYIEQLTQLLRFFPKMVQTILRGAISTIETRTTKTAARSFTAALVVRFD